MSKRKRRKQLTTREHLKQMQHAVSALGAHVDGLNHTVASMRYAIGNAGMYLAALAANDASETLRPPHLPKRKKEKS